MSVVLKITKQPKEFLPKITRIVCRFYRMEPWELMQKKRKREIVQRRQLCMYLAKKYTTASLAVIGSEYLKDHATVLYAIKTIENLITTEREFRGEVVQIQSKLDQLVSGDTDDQLVCVRCERANIWTRIWVDPNTEEVIDRDYFSDSSPLDNWCTNCQSHVEIRARVDIYKDKVRLKKELEETETDRKIQAQMQAIKDEFDFRKPNKIF